MTKLKYILLSFLIITLIGTFAVMGWIFSLNSEIVQKLQTKRFLPPTEYYSSPKLIFPGIQMTSKQISEDFQARNYRLREKDQKVFPGDYVILPKNECLTMTPSSLPPETESCLLFSPRDVGDPELKDNPLQMVVWNSVGQVVQVLKGNPLEPTDRIGIESQLVAQFIGGEPILQSPMALGEMPTLCLNAVLAIEDSQFLEHHGVSLSGIMRAAIKNIFGGGLKQGGSTITQQLVKNYFLTSEKTIKRKVTEFFMSLILENHASKDEILETYLNIIYLGQTGPFQIRGFGAASQYYFEKPIQNLNVSECSLLAAIVNSPGLWDPFRKPDNALKRRKMVLRRMTDLQFITPTEEQEAAIQPLPKRSRPSISETAPYYLHAVNKQLQQMNLNLEGLKIFTGLELQAQRQAQEAVRNQLNLLEKDNKKIHALLEKGHSLEGALLAANNLTGLVTAVVGGRGYRLTQFNRAVDSHRQIGSIMKPFVYLTALRLGESNGRIYDPVTPVKDEKFSYKYDGQVWSPDNYGKKYFGEVPVYFALKNSLNAATASLGLEVGLEKVIETSRLLGIKSSLQALPSLTLGSFELYPTEVLEAYVALARLGSHIPLSFIRSVVTSANEVIFRFDPSSEQSVDSADVAGLVSMMKQTVQSGTAQSIVMNGFLHPAAGKTGTTSDYKDAWFAGFTPHLTAVVWVGYDDNTPHGLTGSSGPVPIWTEYMKNMAIVYPPDDFPWPESTERGFWTEVEKNSNKKIELIFKKGKAHSQSTQ
jgi:penicillin-binding protein 1B